MKIAKLAVTALAVSVLFSACNINRIDNTVTSETETTVVPTTAETTTETTTNPPVETETETTEKIETEAHTDEEVSSAETQTGTTATDNPFRIDTNLLDDLRDMLTLSRPDKPSPDFFNDAVFVGDSVTLGLKNRAVSERNKGNEFLGEAQFLCAGSLNYYSAASSLSNSYAIHPTYKGQKVTVPEGIKKSGAEKVFIMLGMNDFSGSATEVWQSNINKTFDKILELSPDVTIYVQSVTPIANGYEYGKFTNENIAVFNNYLASVCKERGFYYIDINSVLADETGYLNKSYCGDLGSGGMGIHMSYPGTDAWADYLENTFCR
ncbi:MAG: hypothetical protein IJB86_01205 [Clostridia bacterium]|nr:hypothetical protein [Clostridia bacterium]